MAFILKNRELLLIVGLLLISFWLRTFNLAESMSFTYDQGRDMLVLQKMAQGDIRLIGPTTGIPGFFLGPFFYYFLLPGFILSGGNPAGVAIWVAFWTTIVLPFFYFILKPIVGRNWAFLGYLLLLINPGSFQEARIIWNPSLANMLLLPSVWCLFNFKKYPWLLIPAAFLFGLSLQSEIAYTAFLAPLYVSYVIWIWKQKIFQHWLIILLTCLAFLTTLLPEIVFELKNNFLMTNSLIKEMQDTSKKVGFDYVLTHRPKEMLSALNGYVFGHVRFSSVFTLIYGLIMLSSLIINRFKKIKPEEWFWYGMLILPLVAMMSFRGNYGYFFDYYISPHYVPVLACLIIGLVKFPFKLGRILISVLVLVIGLFSFSNFSRVIFNQNNLQYTISQEIRALKKAHELASEPNVGIEVFVPNLLPVQYEYLNQYLAKSEQMSLLAWNKQADSRDWILLWEPPFAGASEIAYQDWRKRNTLNASCQEEAKFGIITVEKCRAN